MVLLGVVLMFACAALAVDAVVQNSAAAGAIAFNQSVAGLSVGAVFIAGAVLGLLFALGLALFTGGVGRRARLRRERRATSAVAGEPYPVEAQQTASSPAAGRHRVGR